MWDIVEPTVHRRTGPGLRQMLLLTGLALAVAAWGMNVRLGEAARPSRAWATHFTAPEQRTADHLRVLFIGNSFTEFNGGVDVLTAELASTSKPLPLFE